MLPPRGGGDPERMHHEAPLRAPVAPARAQTSRQVRRFSLIWALAATVVLAAVALASHIAGGYRDSADARAAATTAGQLAPSRLAASVERVANDRVAYNLTGDPAYVERFQHDAAAVQRQAEELQRTVHTANPSDRLARLARTTLDDVDTWLDASETAMTAASIGRRAGL